MTTLFLNEISFPRRFLFGYGEYTRTIPLIAKFLLKNKVTLIISVQNGSIKYKLLLITVIY